MSDDSDDPNGVDRGSNGELFPDLEPCIRCLGEGEIGMIVGPGAEYGPAECPRCGGTGIEGGVR